MGGFYFINKYFKKGIDNMLSICYYINTGKNKQQIRKNEVIKMTNLTYTFKYLETNARLETKRTKTLKLILSAKIFETYSVDEMVKQFFNNINKYIQNDSNVKIKSVKVGKTLFEL